MGFSRRTRSSCCADRRGRPLIPHRCHAAAHPPQSLARPCADPDPARPTVSRPLPRAHRVLAQSAHEGCGDGRGVGPPLSLGRDASRHAAALASPDRANDLPCRILSDQSAPHPSDLPRALAAIRRPRPGRSRRVVDAPRRRTQDSKPGPGGGISSRRHLRGYARAPDLESLGLRDDPHAGPDRGGAPRDAPSTVLARVQRALSQFRSDRLPPDIALVQPMSCRVVVR